MIDILVDAPHIRESMGMNSLQLNKPSMKTPQEYIEEFGDDYEGALDCSGTVRAGIDDFWLTALTEYGEAVREEAYLDGLNHAECFNAMTENTKKLRDLTPPTP